MDRRNNWGRVKVRLSNRQQSLINAAFSCLQMGACFYLSNFLKHYMIHLVALSFLVLAIVAIQVWKQSSKHWVAEPLLEK